MWDSVHRSVPASHTILTAEKNKGGLERQEVRKTGKEKIKLPLFTDDMIFHIESSLKITHTFTQMHTTARTSALIPQS